MAVKPKQVLLDAEIELDSVEFSNNSNEVTISAVRAEKDVTGFKGGGWEETTGGLKSATININVFQDRSAGGIHQTCAPLFENGEKFPLVIKADDDVVSAENPAHVMIGELYKYDPVSAKVGEVESMSLEIKNGSKLGLKEAKTPEELATILEEVTTILEGA